MPSSQSPAETPRQKVLIVDDSVANRDLLRRTLEPEGFDAFLVPSGEVALQVAPRVQPTLILLDVRMPGGIDGFETCTRLKADPATADIPVLFITVDDEEATLLNAFQAGGVDYIRKPFKEREVVARVQTHARLRRLADDLRRRNAQLESEIVRRKQAEVDRDRADHQLDLISQQELAKWGLAGFVGASPLMTAMIEDLRRLQRTTTTTILILGESGTGKELIARAIHFGGARAKGPFIAMNCSAIPSELAESTLFGHVQGAFTGARGNLKGCFEMADGGHCFWMKSETCPCSCNRSCCGCWRTESLRRWAALSRAKSRCVWSRPRTAN
jgi:DNA-binding NtrC family response regulator